MCARTHECVHVCVKYDTCILLLIRVSRVCAYVGVSQMSLICPETVLCPIYVTRHVCVSFEPFGSVCLQRGRERERENTCHRKHILLHLEALVKIILVSVGRLGQLDELAMTLFDLQRSKSS